MAEENSEEKITKKEIEGIEKSSTKQQIRSTKEPMDWFKVAVLVGLVAIFFLGLFQNNAPTPSDYGVSEASWNGLDNNVSRLVMGSCIYDVNGLPLACGLKAENILMGSFLLPDVNDLFVQDCIEGRALCLNTPFCQLVENDVNSVWVCPPLKTQRS